MASRMSSLTLARFFSSSFIKGQLVKPPIQLFGIEGRYATALYSAAVKEKKLEAVDIEIKKLRDLLKTDKKLADFIDNPVLQLQDKKTALNDVFQKQKFSNLTLNLVNILGDNGRLRLKYLNGVTKAFGTIMSAHRGEIVCEVTTAKPLDEANLTELKTSLQGFVKKGQQLSLQLMVDPSIIGGMIVSIGDKYVDMSVAAKIKTYTQLITEAV